MQQNGNRFYWVGWVVTLLIVALGMAASYGALSSQVAEIKTNGSQPTHELRTRVALLEAAIQRNAEDHATIIAMLKEMKNQ